MLAVIQMSRFSGHCESRGPCSPPKLRSLVWMWEDWEELEGEGRVLLCFISIGKHQLLYVILHKLS